MAFLVTPTYFHYPAAGHFVTAPRGTRKGFPEDPFGRKATNFNHPPILPY